MLARNLFRFRKSYRPVVYLSRRNFLFYSEAALKRITAENLNKFHYQTDNATLFNNAHGVVTELLSDHKVTANIKVVADRIKELIDYNNTGGRGRRFEIHLETYKTLASKDMLSNEHMFKASIMACLEQMMISVFLITDDVLDNAEMRRNKLPWYKVAGREVINDVTLLYSGVFIAMKHFFEKEPYYVPCFEIINEIGWSISLGQSYDFLAFDILGEYRDHLNMETYRKFGITKMTVNAFHAPVFTALYMANYNCKESSEKLIKILDDLGYYLLVLNDWGDCYSKTNRKTPEDIKLGKFSWLLLKAMELSNNKQKEIILKNYGKEDPDCVQAVVNVYDQLELRELGLAFEKRLFEEVSKEIKSLSDPRLQEVAMHAYRMAKYWYKDE